MTDKQMKEPCIIAATANTFKRWQRRRQHECVFNDFGVVLLNNQSRQTEPDAWVWMLLIPHSDPTKL